MTQTNEKNRHSDKDIGRSSPVRMGDIARMAGVSEATVSRALSGSSLVAEKTRKRVLEIVQSTGFQVNEQARRLALGQSRTVEVIFTIEEGTPQRVSDPFYSEMLAVLTDALGDHGYDMLVSRRTPWEREGGSCAFLSGRAEGLIFIGQARHRAKIRDFARAHSRVVTWGAVDSFDDHCVIGTDNIRGGMLVAEHLINIGRASFLFLGDPSLTEVAQRLEGFRLGLEARGYTLTEEQIISTPFDFASARQIADRVFEEPSRPVDAVFAAGDMIAMASMAALRARGLRIPEDVAVVGFDDIPLAAYVEPPLTTIRQDLSQAGRLLVERLLALFDGEALPSVKLPADLIVRQSTIGHSTGR